MGKFINKLLLFKFDKNNSSGFSSWIPDFSWAWADYDNTRDLFKNEKKRMKNYTRHIQNKHKGIYIFNNHSWIVVGWTSLPNSLPSHLKLNTKLDNVYWLFGYHTKEEYRKQGYYRKILKLMIKNILTLNQNAEIYIDCIFDSFVADMFRDMGFVDIGFITSFRIPKTNIVLGKPVFTNDYRGVNG